MTTQHLAEFEILVDQTPELKPKGAIFSMGELKPSWVEALNANGIELKAIDIVVRDQDIAHTFRNAKHIQLSKDWYKKLPHHLQYPDAVILDTSHKNEPALLLIYKGNESANKLVVRLNYNVRKRGVLNIVETGRPISKHLNMIRGGIGKFYVLLEGSL